MVAREGDRYNEARIKSQTKDGSIALQSPIAEVPVRPRSFTRSRHGATRITPTAAPGFWLGLCLVLFATRALWFDIRIVYPELRGDPFRGILLVHAILLAPIIGFTFVRFWREALASRFVWLFIGIGVYGTLGWIPDGLTSWRLVAQDVFKLTLIPAAYLLAKHDPPRCWDRFLLAMAAIVAGFVAFKLMLYVSLFEGETGLYYGGVIDLFSLCVFSAWLFRAEQTTHVVSVDSMSQQRRLQWLCAAAALASLMLVVVGLKRTLLGLVAVLLAITLFRCRQRLLVQPGRFLIATCVVAAVLFWSDPIAGSLDSRLSRDSHASIATDSALTVRVQEIRTISQTLRHAPPVRWLTGFGHGAVFDSPPNRFTGETVKHSVHCTPFAYVLRYGLIGIVFLNVLGLVAFQMCNLRCHETWRASASFHGLTAYLACASLSCLMLYGFVDDMFVGATLGALAGRRTGNGRSQLPRVHSGATDRASSRRTLILDAQNEPTAPELISEGQGS